MLKLFKKFTLSFLAFLVVFLSSATFFKTSAATPAPSPAPPATWYNQSALDFYLKVFNKNPNEIFGERYTYAQVNWIAYSLIGVLAGFAGNSLDIPAIIEQMKADPNNAAAIIQNSGLANQPDPIMTLFSQFYKSPPASGVYYVSQQINKFSIVKTAYAAPTNGFGYSSLEMFLPMWRASRNIAYGLMIVILLMIAFAVMFRLKINPQLTITVQNSIPTIVTALILITFSYAIAGFLIDLMYLFFGLVVYTFGNAGGLAPTGHAAKDLFQNFLSQSLLERGGWILFGGGLGIVGSAVLMFFQPELLPFLPALLGVFIAAIVFIVKGFLMLAETYISLLINIIFAPIIIMSNSIPFIKLSKLTWLRSIVADILVFFVVGLVFFLQDILWSVAGLPNQWGAPYLGSHGSIYQIMVWVGTWAMIPNIRKIVYEMMEKRVSEFQTPREFQNVGREFQNANEIFQKKTSGNPYENWINKVRGNTGKQT